MDKKAQEDAVGIMDMMEWLPRVVVLVVLIFIVHGLVNVGIKNEVDIFDAESEMIIQRLMHSKDSFTYYDADIGRLYPGMLELDKFTEQTLYSMFNPAGDDEHLSMKLTLTTWKKSREKLDVKPIYLNRENFEKWIVLTGFLGRGGKKLRTETFQVTALAKDNQKFVGDLKIEVVMPNDY